ncbi:hypothetical protein BH20ACT9_BH20ACT9_22370 [soil metagenome]
MQPWVMWAVAGGCAALPFVLMRVFNGRDRADGRGRRIDRGWRF